MENGWQYSPYIIPLLGAAIISVAVAIHAWRHRTTSSVSTFVYLACAAAIWASAYAVELSSTDLATKIFWGKVQYLGIVGTPLAWLVFALQFTDQGKWLTRRNLALLSIIPITTLILIWGTERHGLIWQQITMDTTGPFPALILSYGPWFWVNWIFANILVLLGSIALVNMLRRGPGLYRSQTGLLLVSALAPWVGNSIYVLGLNPIQNLDLTPFGFNISAIAVGLGLLRFRFLDLMPIARRVVVDNMNDAVIVLDLHRRIVDLNPAAQHLIKQDISQLIGQTAAGALSAWPELTEADFNNAENHIEIVKENGYTHQYFDLRISPLYDQRKLPTGHLVVLRNITEIKEAEQALTRARDQALEASRLKTELLAKVSHELRTPLSAILGFAEMLQAGAYGPLSKEQVWITQKIVGSGYDLSYLVNDLLLQAQLEAGNLKLHPTLFAPTSLLAEVETKMQVLAQTKGLVLNTEIAPDLPTTVAGDLARLRQIMVNLVANAIKFTEEGTVQVSLFCPDPAHWTIRVSDTGPGIPRAAQTFIFEPFGQVDGSMTRKYGGAGLGLAIVKELVTLMGGRVELDSEEGRGSTFTITLPL